MADLETRFGSLGRTRAPDLWPEIESREPRPAPGPSAGRRLAAGLVAGVVALAGVGLGIWALDGGRPRSPASASANGLIAFASDRGGKWSLYTMLPGQRGVEPVSGTRGAIEAAWSPDGARIAYVGGPEIDVFTVGLDGSDPIRLTDHPEADWAPAWSPDGTRIVFASFRDGDADLYVVGVNGGNVQRLTGGPERDEAPAWSPDSTQIAFQRDGAVYVVNADGSGVREITPRGGSPAWSPDGSAIAFAGSSSNGPLGDIYVMDADGSDVTRLTTSPSADYGPTWSPDGSQIAFVSVRDGNGEVYVMNPDGSGETNVTEHEANEGAPSWQRSVGGEELPNPEPTLEPLIDPRVTARIQVGAAPGSVVLGAGSVWVTLNEFKPTETWALVEIDPETDEILTTIDLRGADDVAFAEGSVWVVSWTQNESVILRIDPNSHEVIDTISVGSQHPAHLLVAGGSIWLTTGFSIQGEPAGEVIRIDPETHEVNARIPIPGSPRDMLFHEGSVWIYGHSTRNEDGSWIASTVYRVDPSTDRLVATYLDGEASLGGGSLVPDAMAAGEGAIWVADVDGRAVRIDAVTGDVARFDVPGRFDWPFVVDEGGVWYWAMNAIERWNTETLKVDARVQVDYVLDSAFDAETGTVWLVNYEDTVTKVDLR